MIQTGQTGKSRTDTGKVDGVELGVFGGTFDPVHNGHLALARAATLSLGLDRLLFMPAAIPPFKQDRKVAPARDRLAMLACALDACGIDGWELSDIELHRPGVSYTSDTLEQLHSSWGADVRLSFLVGTDALASLPRWHEARRIARLARIVYVPRPSEDLQAAKDSVASSGIAFDLQPVEADLPDISSTAVRQRIRDHEPLEGLLPACVERYIKDHGLYQD